MQKHIHLTIRICAITTAAVIAGWIVVALLLPIFGLHLWQQEAELQGRTSLRFSRAALPFENKADLDASLPFMAGAVLDVDNDGREEVFLGGGKHQNDGLFRLENGRFVNITDGLFPPKADGDASMGAASLDINDDQLPDIFVARESGLWLYESSPDGYKARFLSTMPQDNTVPLSIALGDVNGDGWVDFYASGYIRNDLVEGTTIFNKPYGGYSALFINNGDNSWHDSTKEAGLFRQHNTFSAVFADLDNDHDSDLVIAQDTGHVEMYANDGRGHFSPIPNPSVFSYPMGVAAGDYDNDGLIDLYFSNVGHTMPAPLVRGDLTKDQPFNPDYMLFHNEGNLRFTDQARARHAARYGFGWGVVFADMNLDGREDILAAQNYARFPSFLATTYPGKLLLQYANGRFRPVEKRSHAKNNHYGIAPLVGDYNNDGQPDLVWANLAGPARAYLGRPGKNHWLKVRLPNTTRSLNAIVTLTTDEGRTLTKQRIASQGLNSDQTRDLVFGLGTASAIKTLRIQYQDGKDITITAPAIDQLLLVGAAP